MAVVKANAYGHGILAISSVLQKGGIGWLGVNSLEEGILLRQNKINLPILVLGYIPLNSLSQAIVNNLSFVVYNRETLNKAGEEAKKLKRQAKIHLKIETGTNRQGVAAEELLTFIRKLQRAPLVSLEGVYTHFANIEDALDSSFAMGQLKKFKEAIKTLEKAGINIPLKHTASSAAAILFEKTHFDMLRIGIALYGLWPSREVKIASRSKFDLKPVLAWKTKVAQVKKVKKGEKIGYGCTFTVKKDSTVAVLPIGYFDGYDRRLSNCGEVLIKGKRAPVVGRVCMNMIMIDTTEVPGVKLEDEVVLLGKQGRDEISADELAEKIGTINYEVVSRINPMIPRRVV